jgi:hypothetical protein
MKWNIRRGCKALGDPDIVRHAGTSAVNALECVPRVDTAETVEIVSSGYILSRIAHLILGSLINTVAHLNIGCPRIHGQQQCRCAGNVWRGKGRAAAVIIDISRLRAQNTDARCDYFQFWPEI